MILLKGGYNKRKRIVADHCKKFKQELSPIKERLDRLEQRQAGFGNFVASENNKTYALLENKYDLTYIFLKEDYSFISKQISNTDPKLKGYDKLEATVTEHEEALVLYHNYKTPVDFTNFNLDMQRAIGELLPQSAFNF